MGTTRFFYSRFLISGLLLALTGNSFADNKLALSNPNGQNSGAAVIKARAFVADSGADPDAKREYEKGVDASTLQTTKLKYTMRNYLENPIMCNKSGETPPHSWIGLKKDYEKTSGSFCDIYFKYKGGIPSGMLIFVLSYDPPIILCADEIMYRWPVDTKDSSIQIGDSPLRYRANFAVYNPNTGTGSGNSINPPGYELQPGDGDGGGGDSGGGGGPVNLVSAGDCQSQLNTGGKDGAANLTNDCGGCSFTSNADIDTDGAGIRDPDHTVLPNTSSGLNAGKHNFIVLPRQLNPNWKPGDNPDDKWRCPDVGKCAKVEYNGKTSYGVVGDCGPQNQTGEVSTTMANDLGQTQNPNNLNGNAFGDDKRDVKYTIVPSKLTGLNKNTSNDEIKSACEKAVSDACGGQSSGNGTMTAGGGAGTTGAGATGAGAGGSVI